MKDKLDVILNLFEEKEIRSIWDSKREDYYFSVVDVIGALTDASIPTRYWSDLKSKIINEGSQLYEKIVQLKMKSLKDGKMYLTDTLDTEGIFRLIESVPSKKAEKFKLWLAKLGRKKIDEVFDPSKGIDEMIDFYLAKGYTLEWIKLRIISIIDRKKLTKVWEENGVKNNVEYAILTNQIYKGWSGMTANEYKKFKGIHKENLRDNMSDIEVALTNLGELTTRELTKKNKLKGLKQNLKLAEQGGIIAKNTRDDIEKALGESVITNKNNIEYKYIDNNQLEETK